MREILFRGKRKDNNEWVYGGIVHQTDFYGLECDKWFIIDGTDTQDYEIGYEYEIIPKTVSEWTGLHDKNNVRIFEGDIVKQKSDYWKELIGIVEFYRSTFSVNWINFKAYGRTFIGFNNDSLEVIGNIYDNPELIK